MRRVLRCTQFSVILRQCYPLLGGYRQSMNLSGVDVVDEPTTPIYDPENLEKCLAFAGKFRAV